MFRKKSSLTVRPEPPTFAEITEDINLADNADVVFAQTNDVSMHVSEANSATVTPSSHLKLMYGELLQPVLQTDLHLTLTPGTAPLQPM